MGFTCYFGTCKGCLSNQDISSEISETLDSQPMLEHAKVILTNQNISSGESEAWDPQPVLEHAKIV